MNFNKIVEKQRELDLRIAKEHGLEGIDLFEERISALLVEIGECWNEIASFKFWKKHKNIEKDKIKEECIDVLHFIVGVGITCDLDMEKLNNVYAYISKKSINKLFIELNEDVTKFYSNRTQGRYISLVRTFLAITNELGYSGEELEEEYLRKNNINIERQNTDY